MRLDDDLRRGAFGLTADNSDKKPKSAGTKAAGKGKPGSKGSARGSDPHVANALRTAYEEAVKEDVPAEFLDLLGKLS
ncbi:NepR family anti-sigma factor [Sphingomonas sp. MMS24-J13]|uniref:NepR family anti-sigma factor n=1 Tax=Sphingomonas sp. MMS24-J13 TaxID=3238686 RepID=UPI00384CEB18